MNKCGWLINDTLTCIPNTKTFWHNLLNWLPKLVDKTNGYTNYNILVNVIEKDLQKDKPDYIIRNGTYFRNINTDVPQISLIQDITDSKKNLIDMQIDVMNKSKFIIFNTHYMYNKYKKYIADETKVKIFPLGVNFDFFQQTANKHNDICSNSIIYIGDSSTYPKGFNILIEIMMKMENQKFCLVMKDNYTINNLPRILQTRVKIFNRVNTETVKLLINSCICAICTSYEETQHLSGIECGACNIPIIAREVGIYADCKNDQQMWGAIGDDTNFVEKINFVLSNINSYSPREYFINKYSTDICKQNWTDLISGM